ncbi:hypothetical protein [Immundisolibacter sp.]|uniref:hypothetical protein n=1 Tax=Immundisolibacter sp. TaxID=1934948 RepID=UPI0035639101
MPISRRLDREPTRFGHASLLALLTVFFALRVVGQALQACLPQPWLPPFAQFQGSGLGYATLLSSQLLILTVMVRLSWRVHTGALRRHAGTGRVLAWIGAVYLGGSLLRIAVGLALPSAPAWFRAWIPGAFHLVLAGFILVVADFHQRAQRAAT